MSGHGSVWVRAAWLRTAPRRAWLSRDDGEHEGMEWEWESFVAPGGEVVYDSGTGRRVPQGDEMTFLSKKSLLIAIASALIALLALSACGGDDDDDSGDNGGTDVTATEDSGDDGGDDGDDDEEETATEDSGDDGGDDGDDDDGGFEGGDEELAALACELLSPDDIEAAAGISVGDGEPSSFGAGFASCTWSDEDFNTVNLSLMSGPGGEQLFELDLEDDDEDVDGVGDRAHYLPGILATLEFLQDEYYVSVTIGNDMTDDELKDATIDLGKVAADNLP